MKKFGAIYCLYDDHEYLDISLETVSKYLDKILFLMSDVPWNGSKSDNSETISKVRKICISDEGRYELISGHWENEIDQRNFGLSHFFKNNIEYAFIIDSDEVYAERDFQNILKFIQSNSQYDAFHLEWNTYWKKSYHCIYPREHYNPVITVRASHFQFTIIRGGITSVIRSGDALFKTPGEYNGIKIPSRIAICHHLSYARSDEYMLRKLETNSHHSEFIPNWYDKVWKKWTPKMRDLHPVTPNQYQMAVPSDFIGFPEPLMLRYKKEQLPNRKCTIIILNWNSCELLKRCTELVKTHTKHSYEIIVVDNGSTKDDSLEYLSSVNHSSIINHENRGFSSGVNQALRVTDKGHDICLLNVDAEVQEGWLESMYDTMIRFPRAGIVGPLGNEIENGFQREGLIDQDITFSNVHGFCFLIMRELINKIGFFDEQFNPGGCEDLDYCMRARLAGFQIAISADSLVRHKAHQVYELNGIGSKKRHSMDKVNEAKYHEKYFGMLLEYKSVYNYFGISDLSVRTGLVIK